jgi:outer membrane lipoprotein-sorting protein
MAMHRQVKRKFLTALLLVLPLCAFPAERPDVQEILRSVRTAQTSQHRVLNGRLRTGSHSTPFRLVLDGGAMRYEFKDPDETLIVRLGENDSRLDEATGRGTKRVSLAKLDEKVRGSDLTYEDVSFRFLYWKNAAVTGEDTLKLKSCWLLELHPSRGDATQYGTVRAWIEKQSGGLVKAECYGRDGGLAMRLTPISVLKTDDGVWLPKSIRIERMDGDRTRDKTPTYLELESAAK